ncbi:TetR/AcrR family transcriptional regulator [Aggregatilinea lenta]|uniref:TetR/AcrR family transcriptional regulator n=1 Tax=Aggregatilinea lenta TaxID=913108 RepID=UPI0013C365D8|nr:TetR/AcrR family transcriptional regulator [Aggregatilinea lenta]
MNRIVRAALRLFMAYGIKRTSIKEIAREAGVTRVTIYRHCADKRELVRAAFLQSEAVFQQALQTLNDRPDADPTQILDQIGRGIASLPTGDLPARLDELERLYPDVYADLQQVRLDTEGELFSRLFDLSDERGILRPGLNREVARAIIWEILVHVLRNPGLMTLGLSDQDLFNAVRDIILFGISSIPESEDLAGQ